MREEKTYYVCRSYEYGSTKKYYDASTIIDFLSCEAINPIIKIKAHNKKEAINKFKEHIKNIK